MRRRPERYRWQELADYNGRVARGVVHRPDYEAHMAAQQAAFDAELRAEQDQAAAAAGAHWVNMPGGGRLLVPAGLQLAQDLVAVQRRPGRRRWWRAASRWRWGSGQPVAPPAVLVLPERRAGGATPADRPHLAAGLPPTGGVA